MNRGIGFKLTCNLCTGSGSIKKTDDLVLVKVKGKELLACKWHSRNHMARKVWIKSWKIN